MVVIKVTGKTTEDDSRRQGSFWDTLPPEIAPLLRRTRQPPAQHARTKFQGEGSGIIISADGYILTNNHVVENADKIVVRFKDGREFDGEVKGTDPESDIAVIKIKATRLDAGQAGRFGCHARWGICPGHRRSVCAELQRDLWPRQRQGAFL